MDSTLFLAISLGYTTILGWWLFNHVQSIYGQQFDLTDKLLSIVSQIKDEEVVEEVVDGSEEE